MFICENPSLTGVKLAHKNPPMRPPDIEAQWWGGGAPSAGNSRKSIPKSCSVWDESPNGR
jgi:hypothetical protein